MNHVLANLGQDSEIEKCITQRLYWDKRISMADIKIAVSQGVITVSGVVDSEFKKRAALEVISATEGVWSIQDQISVRANLQRTDSELYAILKDEMSRLSLKSGESIALEVRSGVVTLTGRVYHMRLKALAPSLCWELSGVKDCLNFIVLMKPPTGLDAALGLPEEREYHHWRELA